VERSSYWQVKAEWRKLNEELDPVTPQQRDAVLDKHIRRGLRR
jgi:hypothetical protein